MSLWGMMATLLLFLPHISLEDPNEIGVSFCCPPGSVYSTKRLLFIPGADSPTLYASCVPVGDGDGLETLEGQEVMAVDTSKAEGEIGRHRALRIRNTGTQNTTCSYGSFLPAFPFDSTAGLGEFKPKYDIKLEGGKYKGEGNVIFRGKAICNKGFNDAAATVACRMLGYEIGRARYYDFPYDPNDDNNFLWTDTSCIGDEESLSECSSKECDGCCKYSVNDAGSAHCINFIGQANNFLTVDGALVTHSGKRLEPGTFCLERKSEDQAKAFHCPPQTQLFSVLSAKLWDFLTQPWGRYCEGNVTQCHYHSDCSQTCDCQEEKYGGWKDPYCVGPFSVRGELFTPTLNPDYWDWRNSVKLLDKDGSGAVDTEEFNQFFTENLKDIYNLLDQDSNGALEANTEGKILENIPFKLIDAILVKAFSFFDFSGDSIFSLAEDFPFRTDNNGFAYEDRDRNGRITIEEIFRSSPVTWPAPLYKLYTLLDVDKNEDFSLVEVRNFVGRTFTVIDTNKDCKISIKEIVSLVKNIGLPEMTSLSLRLLLKQYTTILNFFFTELIMKADKNMDGRTTFDEVMAIDDLDWANSMAVAVITIGYPNMSHMYGVIGYEIFRRRERNVEEENMERMLDALMTLLEKPAYSMDVQGLCSNFIPGTN